MHSTRTHLAVAMGALTTLACGGFLDTPAPTDWTAYVCPGGGTDCELPDAPTNEIRMGMALGSPRAADALREESEMHESAHIRLNQRMKKAADITWALDASSGPAQLHAALGALDPVVADLVAYAAVRSANAKGEWAYVVNSDGEDACGRGPLKLTYRQARNLGLENVQPDGVAKADVASSDDVDAKMAVLKQTTTLNGEEVTLDGVSVAMSDEVRSGRVCLFAEGPDDRTDVGVLAARLSAELGPDAAGLPPTDDARAIAARLAKLYAADFAKGYPELTFDKDQPVWTLLANQKVGTGQREYVRGNTAHAFGAAVAVRCLAVKDDPAPVDPEKTGCEDALSLKP